jgi:hypothetical protein
MSHLGLQFREHQIQEQNGGQRAEDAPGMTRSERAATEPEAIEEMITREPSLASWIPNAMASVLFNNAVRWANSGIFRIYR